MGLKWSILIKLFIVQYLSVLCLAREKEDGFDFFYFVQQVIISGVFSSLRSFS